MNQDSSLLIRFSGEEPFYASMSIVRPDFNSTVKWSAKTAIFSIARKNGKNARRLDALASNSPAHRLYKNKGFVYRGMQNLYAANNYLKELVNRKNFELNKNFVGFWMMNNS